MIMRHLARTRRSLILGRFIALGGQNKAGATSLLARLAAAVLAAAALGAVVVESSSAATTVPARWYGVDCSNQGYYGDYVLATPIQIVHQAGVDVDMVGTSGTIQPAVHQYIYYWVWVYSVKYGWVHSKPKRVMDGYPSGVPQEWNTYLHEWVTSGSGLDPIVDLSGQYSNLSIGFDQVGIRVPPGTYRVAIETYWTPPFTTAPSLFDPTIPAGGLDQIDYGSSCTFNT